MAIVTYLDAQPLAQDSGPGPAGNGPAIPTAGALTAHRPLGGPGPELTGGLLHDWQQRNRTASLPLALRQLEAAGNLANLRAASDSAETSGQVRSAHLNRAADAVHPATAAEGADVAEAIDTPGSDGAGPRYHGPVFMDSDIYKTLEAIGWELARDPGGPAGADLASFAAATAALLEQAQMPDGYLDSYIQVSGEPRYSRLASSHEMYCAGHLIQAAVAMARAAGAISAGAVPSGTGAARTGSAGWAAQVGSAGTVASGAQESGNTATAARLMAVARRVADHLVATFGGREAGLDGHPVIETALAELYRATGQRSYLDLAAQFVTQRGHGLAGDSGRGHRYLQDHTPIRDTRTEEGHAVRAMYLEAGVVDVAAETGDTALLASSITRWEDMVATKTYLTGGNGSRHSDEAFGDRYELPPDRAYNETCAAIASFHWSWRLLLATGQARYADLMERVLYNAFGAVDLDRRAALLLRQPAAAPLRPRRGRRPGTAARVVLLCLLPAEHHAAARLPPALPRHDRRRHPLPAAIRRSPDRRPARRRHAGHRGVSRSALVRGGHGAGHAGPGRAVRAGDPGPPVVQRTAPADQRRAG